MNFLTNMRISTRLTLAFGVVLMLAIISVAVGLVQLRSIAESSRTMMEKPIAKERLAADMYRYGYGGIRRSNAILKSSDPSLVQFFAEDAKKGVADNGAVVKALEAVLETDGEKAVYAKVVELRNTFLSSREAATKLKLAGDVAGMERIMNEQYLPSIAAYESTLRDMVLFQRAEMDRYAGMVEATYEKSMRLLTVLTVLLVVFATLCAVTITRSITGALRRAVEVTTRIARGDLTAEINSSAKDELGDLLRALSSMKESLSNVVTSFQVGAHEVANRSAEIASGNTDLSSRTEQQAASLEETASSMEELTSTVKQNADNARQANQMAVSASAVAVKGGDVVSQVVTTMGSINQSARKIADIISVIDGIAFQTNILALNAAVEAARAGEQGRGFAVVATEVRTLAQRSAAAAKEIKSLISDSVDKVDAGSRLVEQAGSTMGDIVASVKRVTDIMAEIMAATQEQSAGIDQVNQVIIQMDKVTQQNAALVEEAASSAESLQGQASKLAQEVSFFKVPARH